MAIMSDGQKSTSFKTLKFYNFIKKYFRDLITISGDP